MSKDEKDFAMRNVHIDTIKRMKADIDKNVDNYSYFALDERLKKIQSDLHKFEAKNLQIACADKGIEFDETAFGNENDEMGRLCLDLKAKIRIKMAELDKKENDLKSFAAEIEHSSTEIEQSAVRQGNAHETQSPKIEFPKFNGIFNWQRFEDGIKAKLAENATLTNEEKFIELTTACLGTEAEQIVTRLGDNDFEKAFEKLKGVYGSKYKQIHHAIHELLKIDRLTCSNGFEITSSVNKIDEIVKFLEQIGEKKFANWVPFLAIGKMDSDTRFAWERQIKIQAKSWAQAESERFMHEFVPDWPDVKVFLQDEAELHFQYHKEAVVMQTGEKKAFAQASASDNNKKARINNHCDCDDRHPIHKCNVILAMNLSERINYMRKNKICIQCLWSAHPGGDCADPLANRFCLRCQPDKVKHNSLLCPISYEKARQRMAIVTPMNSAPNWQANTNDEIWD